MKNRDKKKNKYTTPKIRTHGNIKKLTKGLQGPEIDGTAGATGHT